ncbi:MAG: AAA family ATPase [Coprococcus sp.]|nr:AAA family ATPase [Coprococcus sp.]
MVIHVPPAKRENRPIYLNGDLFGNSYRRNWEGDYHCSAQEIKAMLRDQPETTMDMKVLDFMPIEYISRESVEAYRNRHSAYKPGHPWVKLNYEDYLEQLGAIAISKEGGKLHPTSAGLLMFGEEFHIVREFPEYFLDYREMLDPVMRWTDRVQSSSGEWSVNVFDFFFMVYNKLLKEIKTPFRMENGIRIDDTPVHKALREALANCLVNTDYYLPQAVVIKVEPGKITLENPGSIRTGKRQMIKGGISDPRNKTLMKMFNLINIGERAGSGVPDIYSVWEEQGWEEPTVTEQYAPDRTILTLPLVKKVAVKISDKKQMQYKAVLDSMRPDQEYTAADFCEVLDVKISRTKVILKELVEQGKIDIVGTYRNRHYILK